jgi:hypothetical protein
MAEDVELPFSRMEGKSRKHDDLLVNDNVLGMCIYESDRNPEPSPEASFPDPFSTAIPFYRAVAVPGLRCDIDDSVWKHSLSGSRIT